MDRATQLGQTSIPWLLARFSLPAIVGMLAQALYSFIDRVFVGNALGPDAIAGVTVAFPFTLVILGLNMLVGLGGTALISLRLGQQDKDGAEQALGHTFVLLLLASVVTTVVGLAALDPILQFCGADDTVLPYARAYQQVIVLGSVFQMLSFGMNATIRGEGNPLMSMLSMLVSVVLNAVLAPLFIFVFGWGMQGAGLATVVAQAVTSVWVLAYFVGGRSLLRLRWRNLRLQGPLTQQILAIGSPHCAMQLAASVLQAILNQQLQRYGGNLAVAAMGILYVVFMLVAMPIFGINQGVQPIIGYNYGARRFDRVRHALGLAVLAATTLTLAGFVATMLFPAQIIRTFSEDPQLSELGVHAIRLSMLALPLVGFQVVGASYFQAVGKPRVALLLMLSRQVLILIPMVILLPYLLGLDGVWLALPSSDFSSALITAVFLTREWRVLGRRSQESGDRSQERQTGS